MTRDLKYDFGGAEYPFSDDHVVVDIHPESKFRGWDYNNTYIEHDLTEPIDLPPATEINVSRICRYITKDDRYELSKNIDNNLLSGGRVRLFDQLEVLSQVLEYLLIRDYTIETFELINIADPDSPAEFKVILKKP